MTRSIKISPPNRQPAAPEYADSAKTNIFWQKIVDIGLRKKLIIAFLAVALLPMGLLAFLNNNAVSNTLTEETKQILSVKVTEASTRINTFIEVNLQAVVTESQMPDLVDYMMAVRNQSSTDGPPVARVIQILDAFSQRNSAFITSYALLDRRGTNIIDTDQAGIGKDESEFSYFKQPMRSGAPHVSEVLFSNDDAPYLYFSQAIFDLEEQPIGVLRVRFKAEILQQLIVESSDFGAPRESFGILLDENFVRLADAYVPELMYKSLTPLSLPLASALKEAHRLPNLDVEELSTNLPSFQQGVINAGSDGDFVGIAHPGAEVEQGVIKTVALKPDWIVVFVQAQSDFLAPVLVQSRFAVFLALAMSALVIGFAVIVSRILAQPITRLTSVAKEVAGGNLMASVEVHSRDEIGQLAQVFNGMTEQLNDLINSLEGEVQARTTDLTLSMRVGQRAASIRDIDSLLPTIVRFIRREFGFVNTRIFLVDDINENLILRALSGPNTWLPEDQRYSVPIDESTAVGDAALHKKLTVVSEPSDDLDGAEEQLAIPLITEDRVIGVLDLETRKIGTFTKGSLIAFEAMATQLAIAIDGAQQWAAGQLARQRAEDLVRQLRQNAWAETLSTTNKSLGFTYDLSTISPSVEVTDNGLSVPLTLQNQTIGRLAVDTNRETELNVDDKAILSTVAQQLALKVENLRLFNQTQQRASREQVTRQISDKIRASRNIETALKVASEELSRVLNTNRAVVNLKVPPATTEKRNGRSDKRRQPHE